MEKLKDPNIQKTIKAVIGGKFAPLITMKETEEGEDLDTLTGTFSTAITDTSGLVNHQQAVGNGGRPAPHHPIPGNMWTESLSTVDRPQKKKKN